MRGFIVFFLGRAVIEVQANIFVGLDEMLLT